MKHPLYQLGKGKPRRDKRNFQMKALVKARLVIPRTYSVDTANPGLPLRMYGNNEYGDCVIAARANEETRFSLVFDKKTINITDKEVLKEYFAQSEGVDSGLIMLDSLNLWRKPGWVAARKRRKIMAYAEINPHDISLVKQTIFANVGCYVGLNLPTSAAREFDLGLPWADTKGTPGSWGGHCVYLVGYTPKYVTCLTWGQRQLISTPFFTKYCDEAYGVIRQFTTTRVKSFLDQTAVQEHLHRVA